MAEKNLSEQEIALFLSDEHHNNPAEFMNNQKHLRESESWVSYREKCIKAEGFIKKVHYGHQYYLDNLDPSDKKFETECLSKTNFKDEKQADVHRKVGNEYFSANCYNCAIKVYTSSLALSPINSLHAAKAYGNRSAALIEAGMFRECIEDINRAFDSGYPKQDSYKLLMRKAVCHYWLRELSAMTLVIKEMLEISDKMKREEIIKAIKNRKRPECRLVDAFYPDPPPLAYGVNKELPNVSSALSLNYNEKYGRHLVANRDIDIGDILVVEKFYSHKMTWKYRNCDYCNKASPVLIPCDNCSIVMFCSLGCKISALDKFHRVECAALSRIFSNEKYGCVLKSTPYALALRTVATAGLENLQPYLDMIDNEVISISDEEKRKKGFTGNIFDSSNFESVFHLKHHIKEEAKIRPDTLFARSVGCILIAKCLNISPEEDNFYKLASLCLRLISGFYPLTFRYGETYAYYDNHEFLTEQSLFYAIYPSTGFLRPSCNGNTTNYQCQDYNVFRALKPIKTGSTITILMAVTMMQSIAERRTLLKTSFLVDCDCELCGRGIQYIQNKFNMPSIIPSKIRDKNLQLSGETLSLPYLELQGVFSTLKRGKPAFDSRIKDLLKTRIDYLKLLHKKNFSLDVTYKIVEMAVSTLFYLNGNIIMRTTQCQHPGKKQENIGRRELSNLL